MKYWADYDAKVGHVRRYEPRDLGAFFGQAGFSIDRYAVVKVPWPNGWQSRLLIFLVDYFPGVLASVQGWLESRGESPLRTKLYLRNWTEGSADNLREETTALFILKKRNDRGGF